MSTSSSPELSSEPLVVGEWCNFGLESLSLESESLLSVSMSCVGFSTGATSSSDSDVSSDEEDNFCAGSIVPEIARLARGGSTLESESTSESESSEEDTGPGFLAGVGLLGASWAETVLVGTVLVGTVLVGTVLVGTVLVGAVLVETGLLTLLGTTLLGTGLAETGFGAATAFPIIEAASRASSSESLSEVKSAWFLDFCT
jgi:hypothetical protein